MSQDTVGTQSPQSVSDAYVKPTRYAKPVRMLLAKIATKEKRK